MGISFMLDTKNNIVFGTDFKLVSGADALTQDIKNLLQVFKGEYVFDSSKGIDYYDLASKNNYANIQSAIIDLIMSDVRVQGVKNVEFVVNKGTFEISLQIESEYGTLEV
jgi:hypothetical protein